MDAIAQNGRKHAVIYARVSRDEQASNYSFDTQIEPCERYVAGQGFEIVASLKEDYTGVNSIESRPEGHKA